VIQFIRMVLVHGEIPTARANALLVLAAVLSLAVGTFIYRRFAPRAVESL
jgi:ABC-type polysaccharide/polyol phosphate export permease